MRGVVIVYFLLLCPPLFGQWSTGLEFQYQGDDPLRHLVEEHQTIWDDLPDSVKRELEVFHDEQHKALRELSTDREFIVFEGTAEDLANWPARDSFLRAGWTIKEKPKRKNIATYVILGPTHYSIKGYLTPEKLRQLKNPPRQTAPKKTSIKKIVMYSKASCIWCSNWEATEQPKAEAEGVVVEHVTTSGYAPQFDICTDKTCYPRIVGFKTWQQMKAMVRE